MTVRRRIGRTALVAVALAGIGVGVTGQSGGPAVSLSPTSLSFGNQDVNFPSQPQSVTLTNSGGANLAITRISVTGTNANSFSQTNNCGTSVGAGGSCTINVTFTPSSTGNKSASVQIADNAPGSPQLAALSGAGIEPVVSLSSTKLVFSTQAVGTTSAPKNVTLKVGGSDSLNISSITASGDFAQTNTCGSSVPVGSQCVISVTFTPTAPGTRTGAIALADNAPSKTQTIQLTGTGSSVVVSPLSLNFGNQAVGTSSAAQTVTLTNEGAGSLTISGITTTGNYTQSNGCGGSLDPSANCIISVVFTPAAAGTRTGTLQITDSDPSSPQTVSLTGVGTATPAITLSATSLNFSTQLVGTTSKSQYVTITNTGNATVNVSSVTASSNFTVSNNCGKSLPPAGQCTITISFRPAAGGPVSGAVTITDSDPTSPQTISLAGTGTFIKFSKSLVAFPSTILVGNTSAAQSVTVTNTASSSISVSGVMASGDFAQTNTCGGGLGSGASCTVSITFTPTNSGVRTGAVTFTDTDPGSPQSVPTTGTGTFVQLTPSSLSFGNQVEFTPSAARSATLTNTGSSPINFVSILSSGDFSQTNTCGSSLPGGWNCSITVTFTPTAAGTRTGAVTVNDTDATNIQGVALSGSGQASSSTVTISPRAFSLTPSQTAQFTCNVQANWSVDGISSGDTTVGTISASGLYTPPATVGTHLVTATSASDSTQAASAQAFVTDFPGMFNWRYDNAHTGQNLQETVLSTANVNKGQFGKLASYAVDGQVYAQPLYVPGVSIPGLGVFNVVYVATENDSVYAFDADGVATAPLWQTSFINPAAGITTVPASAVMSDSVMPVIGITSTPVIDPTTGTLYVVPYTEENGSFVYRLHALDITTGAEKFGGPVLITATSPGTGSGSSGGMITLDTLTQGQRPALLLLSGVVYVGFASGHMDTDPYHGWLLGYDAASLAQVSVFNSTPNGGKGGIWQGGDGPSADAQGSVYFTTGNGTFDANTGGSDFGDTILKLNTPGLAFSDYFTPFNQAILQANDLDLGSGGTLLLPDQPGPFPHLLVAGGKQGPLYLLNRDNLGQYQAGSNSQIVQSLPGTASFYSTPAYWQGNIYTAAFGDFLKQYRILNGLLSPSAISQGVVQYASPGASPVVSSDTSGDGIVWTIEFSTPGGSAALRAGDAANVATELYNSNQSGARDQLDAGAKFAVPTVANGKVYAGTSGHLTIFGLLP